MSDLNKRIPQLAEILSAKAHFQMVIYSPDAQTTYRIDVDKLLMAEAAAFDGYIIYPHTGASGNTQFFNHDKVMVEKNGVIYKLVHEARPYGSVDLAAEVAAGHWVAIAGGSGGAQYLNDLLDVNTDTAATGQVLYRSGTGWINRTLTAADVGALSQQVADTLYASITHNHDTVYSPIGHNHNTLYSPIGHTHDGLYAPVDHTHNYTLDDLTDVALSSPVNGQVLKLVNGVWTNANESGTPDPTGAVLLAPSGPQTINQGTSKFGVNRTGSFFGGNYTQQLIFDEDIFSWRFNTALDSSSYYSRLNVTPYSMTFQGVSGTQNVHIGGYSDGSETKVELATNNSQWMTTTYNSDQYTVMYWTIGDGQMDFDSQNGRWNIKAKSSSSTTTGTFSVRPDGLYWNNALLSFGGGGATNLDGLTDVTIATPATGNTLRYNGTQWVNYALGYADVGAAAASHTHAFSSLTGVSIASPTTGQYLQFNGTNWAPATLAAPSLSLDGLNDVTITSVASGQVVYFNGTQWINRTLTASDIGAASNTHNHTLGSLTGVTLSNTTSGQYLTFNGTNWVNTTLPAVPTNLDSLTDVVVSAPATNQFLRFNGTNWVNQAVTIVTNLDSLTDVAITSPATNQVLRYNGTNWVNAAAEFLPLLLLEDTTVQAQGHRLNLATVGGTMVAIDDESVVIDGIGGGRGRVGAYGQNFLNVLRTTGPMGIVTALNMASSAAAHWGATVHTPTNEPSVRGLLVRTTGDAALWEMTFDGRILYNGTQYGGGAGGTVGALNDLADVTITSPANGQILQYNGSQWVNSATSGLYVQTNQTASQLINYASNTSLRLEPTGDAYSTALSGATKYRSDILFGGFGFGVYTDGSYNNDAEWWNTFVGHYSKASGSTVYMGGYAIQCDNNTTSEKAHFEIGMGVGTGPSNMTVTIDTTKLELLPTGFFLNTKRILTVDDLVTGGATNLDGLSDVVINSPAAGQVLRHNGTQWVNAVVPDVTASVSGLMSAADKVKLNTHVRSKTPIALTDAATTNFDLAAGYNFTWAISAGNKTINPTNHENGDNWAIDITGCAAQVLSFGPTAGYTHRLAGTAGTVTGVTLPASGTVSLMGRRMGTEIRWSILEF